MPLDFPATRWSLIARLPDRPQEAVALIGLYADAVGGYVRRRLAGERAERIDDIVQDVLVDLMGKPEVLARAQPSADGRFRYFLMNLAWLAALNHLRRSRRRDHASLDSAQPGQGADALPAPDDRAAMDRAWAGAVLQQAFDEVRAWSQDGTLEPTAFAVLHAHLVEGRNLREVALLVNLPLATCHRRLARARMLLQQAIAVRLRAAGELGAQDDAAQACQLLMDQLATG